MSPSKVLIPVLWLSRAGIREFYAGTFQRLLELLHRLLGWLRSSALDHSDRVAVNPSCLCKGVYS